MSDSKETPQEKKRRIDKPVVYSSKKASVHMTLDEEGRHHVEDLHYHFETPKKAKVSLKQFVDGLVPGSLKTKESLDALRSALDETEFDSPIKDAAVTILPDVLAHKDAQAPLSEWFMSDYGSKVLSEWTKSEPGSTALAQWVSSKDGTHAVKSVLDNVGPKMMSTWFSTKAGQFAIRNSLGCAEQSPTAKADDDDELEVIYTGTKKPFKGLNDLLSDEDSADSSFSYGPKSSVKAKVKSEPKEDFPSTAKPPSKKTTPSKLEPRYSPVELNEMVQSHVQKNNRRDKAFAQHLCSVTNVRMDTAAEQLAFFQGCLHEWTKHSRLRDEGIYDKKYPVCSENPSKKAFILDAYIKDFRKTFLEKWDGKLTEDELDTVSKLSMTNNHDGYFFHEAHKKHFKDFQALHKRKLPS